MFSKAISAALKVNKLAIYFLNVPKPSPHIKLNRITALNFKKKSQLLLINSLLPEVTLGPRPMSNHSANSYQSCVEYLCVDRQSVAKVKQTDLSNGSKVKFNPTVLQSLVKRCFLCQLQRKKPANTMIPSNSNPLTYGFSTTCKYDEKIIRYLLPHL